ncbi:hypothetical protein ACJX0J_006656, partial [Zea mays]
GGGLIMWNVLQPAITLIIHAISYGHAAGKTSRTCQIPWLGRLGNLLVLVEKDSLL